MSAVDVLSFIWGLPIVKDFITTQTLECQKPNCLTTFIKRLFINSKDPKLQSKEIDDYMKKIGFSTFSFFEVFSLILSEFHKHELDHLSRTEEFCIFHRFFSQELMQNCQCTKKLSLFPQISTSSIPHFNTITEGDSILPQIFGKIFDYTKAYNIDTCGCLRKYTLNQSPEYLIISLEYSKPENPLLVYTSAPQKMNLTDFFDSKTSEDYYLQGYFIYSTTTNSVSYMHKSYKKKYLWNISTKFIEKPQDGSFIDCLKEVVNNNTLPIAFVYSKECSDFMEMKYFMYVESRQNYNNLIVSPDILPQLNISKDFTWICNNCQILVNMADCICGEGKKNFGWKCKCGKFPVGEICECGWKRPICEYCHNQCEFFETDCKRCGDDYRQGESCGVCSYKSNIVCIGCYNHLENCDVCGYPNMPEGLACARCMNPFMKLFNE
ncbi:hypothetical protein SteCoe_18954 [Stentor coeruleus]|uniref:Uncharacterized protein n=1 Tax=Stentor coeruleus TaxID=5963 RepID=A0A1R2BVB1_9CILI|nr:hypothetical protein SteCoe_18954 [Stentor coeruleus]